MVKRKFEDDAEDVVLTPRPSFKRPAYASNASATQQVLSSVPVVGIDVDMQMDTMANDYPASNSPASAWTPSAYGSSPAAATLYPFPSLEETGMDCDDHSKTNSHRPAFDPVYGRVSDNRFSSDASTVSTNSTTTGLFQPSQDSYTHHGPQCKSVPKIRLSGYPNANGERSMWTHCEDCGAIEMIKGCSGDALTVPRD